MGDTNTIPRSFAGLLGVADVQNSLKRHYFPVPLLFPNNNTTTGIMFGGDSNTTGIPFFQRNLTMEKLYITGRMGTTVNNSTTLMQFQVFKNGVSTVFSHTFRNSTTQAERWMSDSTTPTITNLVSTDRLSVRVPLRNQMTRLSAVIVFRERTDS